jgi:hypothetical protein
MEKGIGICIGLGIEEPTSDLLLMLLFCLFSSVLSLITVCLRVLSGFTGYRRLVTAVRTCHKQSASWNQSHYESLSSTCAALNEPL